MTEEVVESSSVSRRVLIGTGWLAGWRMVSRLIGFVSLLILTQLLVPADFGLVALASSVSASVDAMSQLGVRDALVRLRDETEEYYNTAFTFQAARGLLTGLVIALFSFKAGDWMGEPRLQPILLVLAALAVVSGWENIGTVQLARRLDFRSQVMLLAGPRLLGFVLTVSTAFLLRSYWALIVGTIASKLLAVAVTYLTSPHRPQFSLKGWRYLTHFSLWSWAGSIAVVLWARSDPFILGPVLGTSLLGIYIVAAEIAILPVTELIEPVIGALFPGFAMAHRTGNMPTDGALKVAGALALCAVPFSVGISACAGYLIAALLGQRWMAGQPIISILAWLCMFSPFSYVCGSALSAQGHVRRAFYSNALAAICKIAALATTVHYTQDLSAIAAVNAAVVAVEATLFIWQLKVAGNKGLGQLTRTMARAAIAAALTGVALWPVPGTWAPVALSRAPALLIGGLVGLCAFIVFFIAQVALWYAAGRPDGAEQIMWKLAGKLWQQLAGWVRPVRVRE